MSIELLLAVALIAFCALLILYWLSQRHARQRMLFLEQTQTEKTAELANQLQDWRSRAERVEAQARQLDAQLQEALREKYVLEARIDSERQHADEKLKLLENAQAQLTERFKQLAQEIFEEKSKSFKENNKSQLDQLLNPLGERLKEFQRKVEETYDKEAQQRFSLEKELKNLTQINSRLNEDAVNLTKALTGTANKTQGNWGEMILESILERSGLQKGREYDVQYASVLRTDEGDKRYQPDVLVHLPENRHIVIDAKVSLNAYVRYTSSEDELQRALELRAHIASVRKHINELSQKNYHQLLNIQSPDFVFLFIPVEPAFITAAQHDPALFQDAFDKNLMIVSPSTLLASLRTVANLWRQEYQSRNARDIARHAASLYEKFVGFIDDLRKVGEQLKKAQDSHTDALKKLHTGKGNLVRQVERLAEMGVSPGKRIPAELLADEDKVPEALPETAAKHD